LQDPFIAPTNLKEGTWEDVSPDSKAIEQTADETFANPEKCYRKQCFGQFMKISKNIDAADCHKIT
jgi:hypothetical protein